VGGSFSTFAAYESTTRLGGQSDPSIAGLLLEARNPLVENNGTPGLLEEEASEAHERRYRYRSGLRPTSGLTKVDEIWEWAARIPQGPRPSFRATRGGIPCNLPPLPAKSYWDHAGTFRHARAARRLGSVSQGERQKAAARNTMRSLSSWSSSSHCPTSFAGMVFRQIRKPALLAPRDGSSQCSLC